MPGKNEPDAVPLRAKQIVQTFKYFMAEGGIALLIVVAFGIYGFIFDVYGAVFQFPPDWKPVLRLLLPIAVFASWNLVRVWMRRSREDSKPPAKKHGDKSKNRKKPANGDAEPPLPQSTGRKPLLAWVFIVTGILIFLAYFAFSDRYTQRSTETVVNGQTILVKDSKPDDNAGSQAFVLPFPPVEEFDKEVKWRRGMPYVIDNDKYWLADRLTHPDVAWYVLFTKLILMTLLLIAVSLLTAGTTLLTFLPKRGFGLEDANEAGASFHVPH